MARHECCGEIETTIFAARTNLPVLDFQTWQVWCRAVGAGFVYGFYQSEMGYTIGVVLTQFFSRVNAPSSSKYTTFIDSIGGYYF